MLVDDILTSAQPVPVAAKLLMAAQGRAWPPEVVRLDEILFFFGSVYGGGLDHAIAAAPDDVIPEVFRLIRSYGSDALRSWAQRLERLLPTGLLSAGVEAREDWHSQNMEAPSQDFEVLYRESHSLDSDLGNALCEYVREHEVVFRKFEQERVPTLAEAPPNYAFKRTAGRGYRVS
jgi:hypothetical protein